MMFFTMLGPSSKKKNVDTNKTTPPTIVRKKNAPVAPVMETSRGCRKSTICWVDSRICFGVGFATSFANAI